MNDMIEQRRVRARQVKAYGTLQKAVEVGALEKFQDVSLSEAIVLGLVNQGVKTFIGIFGHGMTDVGEALRVYEEEGAVRTINVRNEVEASHAAAMLRWKYNEIPAVFTSGSANAAPLTPCAVVFLRSASGRSRL